MNSTLYDTAQSETRPAAFDRAVVATYLTHDAAEQSDDVQSDDVNARTTADAQIKAQVEDQEGPRLGDLGSLEE